jgi:cell division protein ZapA (FtsZ GTPase activity inhibitor)
MSTVSTLEVKLLGQRIVLKSSETDPELIREVLDLVSRKLDEAENRSRGAPPHQTAVLALLDLAEEYIQAKKRTLDFKQQLDEKSSELLSLVETEFK